MRRRAGEGTAGVDGEGGVVDKREGTDGDGSDCIDGDWGLGSTTPPMGLDGLCSSKTEAVGMALGAAAST